MTSLKNVSQRDLRTQDRPGNVRERIICRTVVVTHVTLNPMNCDLRLVKLVVVLQVERVIHHLGRAKAALDLERQIYNNKIYFDKNMHVIQHNN